MNSTIRSIREEDRACVLSMMREFYSSPAVFTNGSDEIFLGDIDACLSGSPYLEGYVIEGEAGICGYMMLSDFIISGAGVREGYLIDFIRKNFPQKTQEF